MKLCLLSFAIAAVFATGGFAEQALSPQTARVMIDSAPTGPSDSEISQIQMYYPTQDEVNARQKREYFDWVQKQLARLKPVAYDTRITNTTDNEQHFRFYLGTTTREVALRIAPHQTHVFRFWASATGGSPHVEYYPLHGSQKTVTKILEPRIAYEFAEEGDLIWLADKGPLDPYQLTIRNTTGDDVTVYATACRNAGWPHNQKLKPGASVTFELSPGPDCDEPLINFNKAKWSPNSWTYSAEFGAKYEIQNSTVDGKAGRALKAVAAPARGGEKRLRPDLLRPQQ